MSDSDKMARKRMMKGDHADPEDFCLWPEFSLIQHLKLGNG
jgi:hypothetical protein